MERFVRQAKRLEVRGRIDMHNPDNDNQSRAAINRVKEREDEEETVSICQMQVNSGDDPK